jgi:hypothetical protein
VCAWQAVAGAGFDWKFSEEAVDGGIMMRMMSMMVSIGGMLITALLLGIVSGGPSPLLCDQMSLLIILARSAFPRSRSSLTP